MRRLLTPQMRTSGELTAEAQLKYRPVSREILGRYRGSQTRTRCCPEMLYDLRPNQLRQANE